MSYTVSLILTFFILALAAALGILIMDIFHHMRPDEVLYTQRKGIAWRVFFIYLLIDALLILIWSMPTYDNI